MRIVLSLLLVSALALTSCATTETARLTADLDQTKARISGLEALNRSLDDELAARTAELGALRAKWTVLNAENAELVSDLAALKTGKTTAEATYLGQIDALQKEKASLRDRISALEAEVATLTQEAGQAAADLDRRIAELKKTLADPIAAGNVDIKRYRDVLVISVKDSIVFQPDSPALVDQNEAVLRALADLFKRLPDRIVRIEGNTAVAASPPAVQKLYPTSWHLGAARAANVGQFLQEQCGLDPHQLVVTSLGEYSPRGDNTTEAGRSLNRRVEFVLVSRSLWELDRLNSVLRNP